MDCRPLEDFLWCKPLNSKLQIATSRLGLMPPSLCFLGPPQYCLKFCCWHWLWKNRLTDLWRTFPGFWIETKWSSHSFSNELQAAFTCIKNLWNRKPLKVYGGRMAESMLAILCHILRGEPVIRERLSKEKEGSRGEEDTGQEEGGSRREPQVNQQQLQQVGFWPHTPGPRLCTWECVVCGVSKFLNAWSY